MKIKGDLKDAPVFRSLLDQGGGVSLYAGPSGPVVTLSRVVQNVAVGDEAGKGLPRNPLSDPESP